MSLSNSTEFIAKRAANNLTALAYLVNAKHFGVPAGNHPEDPVGGNRDTKIAALWTVIEADSAALKAIYNP